MQPRFTCNSRVNPWKPFSLSRQTAREGVFADVYPGARYLGEDTRPDERQESGADNRYVFRNPKGELFYVFERDSGEVFIDVSRFKTGEAGSAVYAAVGNYAYNTGRRFIADPAGLTPDSLIRRTTNMLSLALRYGTTRHIEPGEQQLEGDKANGVEPLKWSGDDVAKTRALIHTFITTFHNKAPEFKDVRYDFNRRAFIGRLGQPVDRETFKREALEGAGRAARAGEATSRRGILIQSLVSSESGQRPGILEQVLSRARALVLEGNLDESFSRRSQKATFQGGFAVSGLRKTQIRAIVDAIRGKWKNAPEIVIVEDMNDPAIPDAVRLENQRQLSRGATGYPEGFFADGRVYIVASQIERPGDVARVLLHESLGHFGLRGLYGEGLNKILKQVAALRRRDVEAMANRYGLDMENEVDRLQAAEEVLAHLAQTRPQSSFVQRAIAAIRKWLREHIPGFANLKLTDGEIIENYLLPARRFVERGGMAAQGEMAGAFSRGRKDGIIQENNRRLAALRDTMKPVPNIAAALEAVRGNEEKKINGFLRKSLTNLETGMKATVTGVSLNKMKDRSAWQKSDSVMAHYHALANLDVLFELATHTIPGREGRKPNDAVSLKALHKFTTPMPYEDKVLSVVMTVREFIETGKHGNQLYTFEALEIVTPASIRGVSTVPVSQARHLHPPAGVTPRLMEMIAIVKGEVKPGDIGFSRQSQTDSPAFKHGSGIARWWMPRGGRVCFITVRRHGRKAGFNLGILQLSTAWPLSTL